MKTQDGISRNPEKLNGVVDLIAQLVEGKAQYGETQMVTGSRLPQFEISNRGHESHAAEDDLSLRNVIESGDFRIEFGSRAVRLCGEELELSSEEFEVLVYLVNHPQRLITANTVLVTSWTNNLPRQTEFLRVLLSLRKKLDLAAPGKHYLRTEPWVVYRFDPTPPSRM